MKIASVTIALAAAMMLSKADGKGRLKAKKKTAAKPDVVVEKVAADNEMDEDEEDMSPLPLKVPKKTHKKTRPYVSKRPLTGIEMSDIFPNEFAAIDGFANNRDHPDWGCANTTYLRLTAHAYNNSNQSGADLPGPRFVSASCMGQEAEQGNAMNGTSMVWIWGQFIDHDLDLTSTIDEKMPIECAENDTHFNTSIPFSRSFFELGEDGAREQFNEISACIDANTVYGVDEDRAEALRGENGMLKTSESESCGPLMPKNVDGFRNAQNPHRPKSDFFLAGDVRANEHPSLIAMHTLFVREHNYWANFFGACDSGLESNDIYEMARMMVISEVQQITYNEFLPLLLGKEATPECDHYDPSVNPAISNEFATVAFRMGHSQVPQHQWRLNSSHQSIPEGPLRLLDCFFDPDFLSRDCLEVYFRGASFQECEEIDLKLVGDLQNLLFAGHTKHGLDLAAINIQRGNDHGLCDYNSMRAGFGLPKLKTFDEFQGLTNSTGKDLEKLYVTPDRCHPWVCMLAEKHVPGAMVGETMQTIIAEQFNRTCVGDRFFWKHSPHMSNHLKRLVDKTHLSDIIIRNTKITSEEIPRRVFRLPLMPDNAETWSRKGPKKSDAAFAPTLCHDPEVPDELALEEAVPGESLTDNQKAAKKVTAKRVPRKQDKAKQAVKKAVRGKR